MLDGELVEKRLNFSAYAVDLFFLINPMKILCLFQTCNNINYAVFQLANPSDSSDSHPFWIQMTVIVLILAILMRITVFVFSEGWKATCDLGKLLSIYTWAVLYSTILLNYDCVF